NNNGYNNNGYNNNGYNNNGYNNNGYNYNNPYNYGRPIYRQNIQEPGSSLASAAKVLGIISLVMSLIDLISMITSLQCSVYPAFMTGATAIVLALLSKGMRPKLPSAAKNGIITGTVGLVLSTIILTSFTIMLFTNDTLKARVNETFESIYGQTFDEMLEEILEESGYTD
ncbi:MAG: hypothetical protein NC433_09460, partial [Clostridiales bacterium]|nr:hypothetical protein [Clostridiales bacterium]